MAEGVSIGRRQVVERDLAADARRVGRPVAEGVLAGQGVAGADRRRGQGEGHEDQKKAAAHRDRSSGVSGMPSGRGYSSSPSACQAEGLRLATGVPRSAGDNGALRQSSERPTCTHSRPEIRPMNKVSHPSRRRFLEHTSMGLAGMALGRVDPHGGSFHSTGG